MTANLLHRLTTAPAGSRELDEAVAVAVGWKKGIHHGSSQYQRQDGRWFFRVPAFTTDLNATFAEAQRRGMLIVVRLLPGATGSAHSWFLENYDGSFFIHNAATPALAACAALIAAVGENG
jgi:hypothetical protein